MSRYWYTGVNSTALDSTSTLTNQSLIGRSIPDGSVFYLRKAWFYTASGGQVVHLYDVSAGVGATSSRLRGSIPCATGERQEVEFPEPGLMFSYGVGVIKDTTSSGYFGVGAVGGGGYFVR